MATPDHAERSETEQTVIFSLAGGDYALRMSSVKEIIPYTEPRAISCHKPMMRGIISLRGRIIPVCDLAGMLDEPEQDGHGNIIIVESGDVIAGILVQRVQEVIAIRTEDVAYVPAAAELTNTIVKLGERLVVLLDAGKLLRDLEHGDGGHGGF